MLYWKQAKNKIMPPTQAGSQVYKPFIQPEIAADVKDAFQVKSNCSEFNFIMSISQPEDKVAGLFTAEKGVNKQRGGKVASLYGKVRDR